MFSGENQQVSKWLSTPFSLDSFSHAVTLPLQHYYFEENQSLGVLVFLVTSSFARSTLGTS